MSQLRLEIAPSYAVGFCFSWSLVGLSAPPMPLTFVVEQSPTGVPQDDTWQAISPAVASFVYQEEGRTEWSKDRNLFFRVRLQDGAGAISYSPVVDGYGTLGRREFLLAQELMRQKSQEMAQMSGVCICLWKRMHEGIPCADCLDPITGVLVDPDCRTCHGTKFLGGYMGPYTTCGEFTPFKADKKYGAGAEGVDDDPRYNVTLVGFPRLIRGDVLRECKSDVMFRVHQANNLSEIRRIPIIQQVAVTELSREDIVHFLGHAEVAP